jgi:uncharacterized membrane protein YtjA (UPF0391 family)
MRIAKVVVAVATVVLFVSLAQGLLRRLLW